MNKVLCFEYIVFQLLKWHLSLHPKDSNFSSFTRLKVLKLLFFVSAIHKDNEQQDLLDIFDKFYAMQHGPVESDIYNAMIQESLIYYSFKSRVISFQRQHIDATDFNELPENLQLRLEQAVELLQQTNETIIDYSASQLVELSHKWDCWRLSMHLAQILAKGSELMDVNLIRNNNQYYSI